MIKFFSNEIIVFNNLISEKNKYNTNTDYSCVCFLMSDIFTKE